VNARIGRAYHSPLDRFSAQLPSVPTAPTSGVIAAKRPFAAAPGSGRSCDQHCPGRLPDLKCPYLLP
jgi:hypothetical protein